MKKSLLLMIAAVLILSGCESEHDKRQKRIQQLEQEIEDTQKTLDQIDWYCDNGGEC